MEEDSVESESDSLELEYIPLRKRHKGKLFCTPISVVKVLQTIQSTPP